MIRGDKLGEGTFGIVYSAFSPNSGKEYAIKRNLVENETSFIGSLRELDLLNQLRDNRHITNIISVSYGDPFKKKREAFSPLVGKDKKTQKNDFVHFVFEKANCDLHEFIYGSKIVEFDVIKKYMVHMLLGVEYIHSKKIIHRDIKPSNVLLFKNNQDAIGNFNIAKICDFGLSKPFTYQGINTPYIVTTLYRAPEITLENPKYDYKIDIWALGCVFYEMIAKKPFIQDNQKVPKGYKEDDIILSNILGNLPTPLSLRTFRELVRLNKFRDVKLTNKHNPAKRRSFIEQFGLTVKGKKEFENKAGDINLFSDLLERMLCFDWNIRYTATQCLDHPFFSDYKDLIDKTRRESNINFIIPEHRLYVRDCVERKWMANIVKKVFNNRKKLEWYINDRVIFQAIDIFDRYLTIMFHSKKIPKNAEESELKGLIHTKKETELRFITCIYLSIKYFSTIHFPILFESLASEEYHTDKSKLIAEKFEIGLVKNGLEYNIYRPTIYEAADESNDILDDIEIRDIIILYTLNSSFSGLKPTELYKYYKQHLKGKDLELYLEPINRDLIN
jgi:serine/threonine protein kinase